MTTYTRADLLKLRDYKNEQRIKQNVDLVATNVIRLAEQGKTVYDLDIPLSQDLIEDIHKVLQQRFPDSKMEIVEKVHFVSKMDNFLGFYWMSGKEPVRSKSFRIDWS